jgi:hypothetical protein
VLTAILGLVGVGGVGAAALFFVPGLLPAAVAAVGVILRCKLCLVVIAVCVAFLVGDVRGYRRADAKWRAADVAMQLKAKERDLAILEDQRKFALAQLSELASEDASLKKKLDDYEKSPKTACPIGADRAKRLRDILR